MKIRYIVTWRMPEMERKEWMSGRPLVIPAEDFERLYVHPVAIGAVARQSNKNRQGDCTAVACLRVEVPDAPS